MKSNMQSLHAARWNGPLGCALDILREEGVQGLYRGLGPRLVRVSVEVSLVFTLFEYTSRGLNWAIDGRP